MTNRLFYGDNLEVLRQSIADESVDLIYLDPPFNSAANYNLLFKAPDGKGSESQIEAFEDTWHWGDAAALAYQEVLTNQQAPRAALMLRGIVDAIGRNDMTAYLSQMAVRLIELRRVLRPDGGLYLHCDPTASHYLKLLLDGIFGPECFRNEIIWERTNAHNLKSRFFSRSHDTILFYGKSEVTHFKHQFTEYGPQQMKRYRTDEEGRLYTAQDLTFSAANAARQFTWRGTTPPPQRSWGASLEQLEQWFAEGRILLKADGTPRLDGRKVYLDDMPGKRLGTVWIDIERVGNTSSERLGYPTQKPLALLERILASSSEPGDVVLDPFCGCGTAVHAAEKLGRQWIGIDVTHLAISLVERRLKDAFPGLRFDVHGTPKDLAGARDLAARGKHQFEYWAVSLVDAVPQGGARSDRTAKKGSDRGIDGIRWVRTGPKPDDLDRVLVSVKAGETVGVAAVRDLAGTVEREGALGGLLITLAPATKPMLAEAASHGFASTGLGQFRRIMVKTVQELMAGVHDEAERLPPVGRQEGFRRARREKRGFNEAQAGMEV